MESEDTAIQLAEVILLSIYSHNVKNRFPLTAKYDKEFAAWVIIGTLDKNSVGGVPTIILRAEDGKVMYVSHSK